MLIEEHHDRRLEVIERARHAQPRRCLHALAEHRIGAEMRGDDIRLRVDIEQSPHTGDHIEQMLRRSELLTLDAEGALVRLVCHTQLTSHLSKATRSCNSDPRPPARHPARSTVPRTEASEPMGKGPSTGIC